MDPCNKCGIAGEHTCNAFGLHQPEGHQMKRRFYDFVYSMWFCAVATAIVASATVIAIHYFFDR